MNDKVCVLIPIYKDHALTIEEYISISNNIRILSNYDIFFLHDPSLDTGLYRYCFPEIRFKSFCFKNRQQYSNMCLDYRFYDMLKEYEYVLICQTDAYVFKDELSYWCSREYDYIGALGLFIKITYPYIGKWDDKDVGDIHSYPHIVLNGGFSLRKVQAMYDLCFKHKDIFSKETFNEDCVICWRHWDELNMPPLEECIKFSAENQTYAFYPEYYDELPFGCHTVRTKYRLLDIFKNNSYNK